MGPTASGKTDLAVRLVERLPFEIISVDSALVYRGMDIGTAKPAAEVLARAPHRLLDIREPEETYSAGEFVRDARRAMDEVRRAGRVPLLVGGTMMYFRALTGGLASLPAADPALRSAIDAEARRIGWPALHRELAAVDPAAADRVDPHDAQRIQRALEVYRASGRPLSAWQAEGRAGGENPAQRYLKLALVPEPRRLLHERIEQRFLGMLERGFLEEVRALRRRPGLTAARAAMRAVGYRQMWAFLDGECGYEEAVERGVAATRQLAKRQLTWLRGEAEAVVVNPLEPGAFAAIWTILDQRVSEIHTV